MCKRMNERKIENGNNISPLDSLFFSGQSSEPKKEKVKLKHAANYWIRCNSHITFGNFVPLFTSTRGSMSMVWDITNQGTETYCYKLLGIIKIGLVNPGGPMKFHCAGIKQNGPMFQMQSHAWTRVYVSSSRLHIAG